MYKLLSMKAICIAGFPISKKFWAIKKWASNVNQAKHILTCPSQADVKCI